MSSGYYEFAVNNNECANLGLPGFNSIDSVNIYTINGGTISYNGFFGYCGNSGADITAYSHGCSSPNNLGNQFVLTDISGNVIDSTVSILDSIVYTGLLTNQYILHITNLDNNCISIDGPTNLAVSETDKQDIRWESVGIDNQLFADYE